MTDAKHTPGPWKVEMVCVSGRGKHSMFRPCVLQQDQGEHGGICEVYVSGDEGRKITNEDRANARLIAEAGTVSTETGRTPRQLADERSELLEAAKLAAAELKREHEDGGCGHSCPENFPCSCDHVIPAIESAISKAEGRS